MKVNYEFDTAVPGDLALLAIVQKSIKIVEVGEPAPEQPAAGPPKAAKKSTAKKSKSKDPDLAKLDFDGIVEALEDIKKPVVEHARFLAKAFCKKIGDVAEGKRIVRSVLKAVGARNFDDLEDFGGFIDQLIAAADNGDGDDLDI